MGFIAWRTGMAGLKLRQQNHQNGLVETERENMKKFWIIFCAVILVIFAVFGFVAGSKHDAPLPPISISWRRSALDSAGLVMQVQNTSNERLSCMMAAVNETQGQHTAYSFDVGPYKISEIGIVECGWSFKSGEGVAIRSEGYSDYFFKVP
jgi:hypothetical protein